MNYYDSDSYKIVKEFRASLACIMQEGTGITRQIERGTLYYLYTKRILFCLDIEEAFREKAAQEVVLEFANFAVEMGRRIDKLNED